MNPYKPSEDGISAVTENIVAELKKTLSAKRLYHSICVGEMSVRLAKLYGYDLEKARTAGLLHDIAKELPDSELLQLLTEGGCPPDPCSMTAPQIWHAPAGAVYIRKYLGITDPDILNAVRYHTTGRAGMTLGEKICLCADFVSEDRQYPTAEKCRELALRDLDAAVMENLSYSIRRLVENGRPICEDTVAAYNDIALKQYRESHPSDKKEE